jgi:hypothetical protein
MRHQVPTEDLLQDYPELEPDDIRAALAYAASVIIEIELAKDSNYVQTQVKLLSHSWFSD